MPPAQSLVLLTIQRLTLPLAGSQDQALDGYNGPVHHAGQTRTYWPGAGGYSSQSTTMGRSPRPEGGRLALNNWKFEMWGGTAHELPHPAFAALDATQQQAFNSAGENPLKSFFSRSGGGHAPSAAPATASPSAMPSVGGNPSSCSTCGLNGNVKRFATRGGHVRPLCDNCVFDQQAGDQEAFKAAWAEGMPV